MNARNKGKLVFIKVAITLIWLCMIADSGLSFAGENPGAVVDPMKLMTSTAAQDPARPEMARVIATAFKSLGWEVTPYPIQYNQCVQKVIMEWDYDMWLFIHGGSPRRIDPHPYISKKNHSLSHKKGDWNWEGSFDPVVDKLAEAQMVAMDVETRRQIVFLAQKLIHENQFYNVLANVQQTNAYRSDRIKNVVPMMGEGIGSFWTDVNMEVIRGDGYIRTGSGSSLKTLNPIAVVDQLELMEVRMIYDRLFRVDPEGRAKPWAAESYKIVNSTTIDVTIRKGMKFHDGVDVTAEDIKFSFDYAKDWKAPLFVEPLRLLDSVDITGKYNVRFKLKEPVAHFIHNLLAYIFIIPKHIWQDIPEKVDLDDPLKYPNEKPIGSGPFMVDYWDRGRELKVSSFKEHFHMPKVAGIIRMVYGSHEALAVAIEKGECDRTRYILKPSYIQDLQKVENVTAKGYPSHGFYCLSYNSLRPPLDDPVFRKAIAHVIPKELISEVILSGLAKPGGSVIAPANKFWHNPAVKPFPEDVAKAKRILADAGYFWDKKGKLHYPKK